MKYYVYEMDEDEYSLERRVIAENLSEKDARTLCKKTYKGFVRDMELMEDRYN